ncbi:MAG TPA: hypothetical protein PLE54_10745 [Burkholderiaceae bacterium]|nr:hypothetical protein [Burkholderiaceae bacterium]HQR71071.1 hypothetical protein [Burkholderiaceae bacterium]
MKRIVLVAAALAVFMVASAHAATLGEVAAAIAAPAGSPQATNDWSAFSKLKGAKWQGNAPKRGGNQYYWNAKLSYDGLGPGELSLVGTQKNVTSATAGVSKKIELAQIQPTVAAQLPKDTKIEQVRGACPGEVLSGSRIYRVTLAGRKPLYLHAQSVTDDKSGAYTSFEFEPQRNRGWIC